jgi:hypothetical protein
MPLRCHREDAPGRRASLVTLPGPGITMRTRKRRRIDIFREPGGMNHGQTGN